MPTNPYFSTHSKAKRNEQDMLETAIDEIVKIAGLDVYYIPRTSEATLNNLLGEQPDTRLTDAYPLCVYIVNVEGYDDVGETITKIGWNIRSSTNMVVTHREFTKMVPAHPRPLEGSIIWVPILRRLFEIKFVDPDVNFHAIGRDASRPYYYELRLEQFKFSQENISTGVPEIDNTGVFNSYTIQLHLGAGTGNYQIGEEVYQGNNYISATATATVSDWNPTGKILSIINVVGEMNAASNVVGTASQAAYVLSDYNDLEDHVPDDISDNAELETITDDLLVTSETNPLG